ncbi:hypothetical protein GMMP15_1870003 [Candidatus Magnetomoraceae bacterium gMMP-15]
MDILKNILLLNNFIEILINVNIFLKKLEKNFFISNNLFFNKKYKKISEFLRRLG